MGVKAKSAKCSPREVLEQYGDGVLPKKVSLAVRRHIAECPTCLAKVEKEAWEKAERGDLRNDPRVIAFVKKCKEKGIYPSQAIFDWFDQHMQAECMARLSQIQI